MLCRCYFFQQKVIEEMKKADKDARSVSAMLELAFLVTESSCTQIQRLHFQLSLFTALHVFRNNVVFNNTIIRTKHYFHQPPVIPPYKGRGRGGDIGLHCFLCYTIHVAQFFFLIVNSQIESSTQAPAGFLIRSNYHMFTEGVYIWTGKWQNSEL